MGTANGEAKADMGHGQIVAIRPVSANRWEVAFSKEGEANYAAPAVRDIQVEAIDQLGMVHPLLIVGGANKSMVSATGKLDGALRARVIIQHGDHIHTREMRLPGAADIPSAAGPGGGTLIDMGHDNLIEVSSVGAGSLQVKFLAQKAPSADDVVMEAIFKEPVDSQVHELDVTSAGNDTTLNAKGDTKGCSHIRIAIVHGDHVHTRTAPMAL